MRITFAILASLAATFFLLAGTGKIVIAVWGLAVVHNAASGAVLLALACVSAYLAIDLFLDKSEVEEEVKELEEVGCG